MSFALFQKMDVIIFIIVHNLIDHITIDDVTILITVKKPKADKIAY